MPIPIRVVLITAFEPDAGPVPGELRHWIDRNHLDTVLPFPQGYRDLRFNEQGVLAITTGVGAARAAASVMALGLDPRFDLTYAFILINGIAGIDPVRGSLASAVWCDTVVDGSFAHEIDAREIPQEWPDGFVPIGKSIPYEQPLAHRFNGDDGIVFRLNSKLSEWAFELSRDTELLDTPAMAERRAQFVPSEVANRKPYVLRGAELSSTTFWHGHLLSQRARNWVNYQTEDTATYTITGMEDTGILQSLRFLADAGHIDFDRVLILRTASNFDQQRTGITAAESLAETKVARYSAYLPALENAHRVGNVVVQALLALPDGDSPV
ncbi:purine nucleoside permease [Granulicella sp. WH15]|uniref:purine-nucleoside phosphorylase n=1 Tax=Granulicella sp. WH15 TaxID=2602070 RepID=UPI0013676ABF|nr:purine nucleoside permease [Granulicella sp. WH15]QHN04472.1 purine nucleoside permease [Granulicella sp. WH15]